MAAFAREFERLGTAVERGEMVAARAPLHLPAARKAG